jgi:cytochrome c oxidase subunit 3
MEPTAGTTRWSGGISPWGVSWQKAMMWFFIVGDALLFAGFLASYGFARLASESWPDRHAVFPMGFVTVMTFVLISSSATMASAVAAARGRDASRTRRFLLLTILGGALFLAMQAYEWAHFIGAGARMGSNPWGAGQFSAYFFLITGFHGTHVLVGLIVLLTTTLRRSPAASVELAGLYWHFVDLVWVFVFGFFYLV